MWFSVLFFFLDCGCGQTHVHDKWNLTASQEIYHLTQMSLASIPNKGLAPAKRMKRLLADVSPTPLDKVYNEGRKPHADEKQTITSICHKMTVPEISQCTISLQTIQITTFTLDVTICTFNHMKYFLFLLLANPEYQPPMCTAGTCGSLCTVLVIAGLLLQRLLTTSLWHQPKCQ